MLEKKLSRRSPFVNTSGATDVYVLEDGLDNVKLAGSTAHNNNLCAVINTYLG